MKPLLVARKGLSCGVLNDNGKYVIGKPDIV